MSCQEYEAQIGDYVDDAMSDAERSSFESHLATCAQCQAIVADFQAIRSVSLSLEPRLPSPQVWRKIEAAIEAEPTSLFGFGNYWWRVFAPVAAMAVLVASLTWTAVQLAPAPSQRVAGAVQSPSSEPTTILSGYQLAERDLANTIEGLERIAETDRTTLDMETADVLQANLTVLDGAIGESREALQKEPENDVAQQSLFDALRNKVALLQDIIALINEMRKGNQEGAARIVSGLNQ